MATTTRIIKTDLPKDVAIEKNGESNRIIGIGNEVWLVKYWRPAIAWQYFAVCLCDFIIFPSITFMVAKWTGTYTPWDPLTLKESGFYHLSMAAIVGVSAWSRGQEKIKKMDTLGMEIVEETTTTTDPSTKT
jgi:hypothetical protein